MENDKSILRSKFIGITVFITAVVIVLLVRLPLFGLLVDIFIAVNVTLTLFLFIYTIFVKRAKNFTLYLYTLALTAVYGFVLSIAVPKSILDMKMNYDGKIVQFISSFFEGIERKQMLITIVCIVSIVAIHEIFLNKSTDGVIKTSNDYIQVHHKDDFLFIMDSIYAVFTLTRILGALINMIIILSIILMEPLLNEAVNEDTFIFIYNTYMYYIPLVIGNSIVCIIPYFLLSSTVRRMVIRYVEEKERSHEEI